MKCPKCDKETDNYSKFCSNCGEKIRERESLDQLDNIVKMCSQTWFMLGYMRGVNKDDKKALEEFEDILKKSHLDIWEWYQEVVNYWEERAKQNNEKNKKTNGSKRASIPKTERIKAQQK